MNDLTFAIVAHPAVFKTAGINLSPAPSPQNLL
jgi:hypothetical protein